MMRPHPAVSRLAHDIALAVSLMLNKYEAGTPELALYFSEPNGDGDEEVLVHKGDLVQPIGDNLILIMHPGREQDPEFETQVFRADFFTRMIVVIDENDIAAVAAANPQEVPISQ